MALTPNFGFEVPVGSDTVNLLTQCYPNFTSLDSLLVPMRDNGVSPATHTKVGTVHQLVRTVGTCNVFKFVATANMGSGDTFTVDGVSVTATAVNGTSLQAGSFVINQSVLCLLNGSVLTVIVSGVSSVSASDVTYDNTGSGLTATNAQNAIDEINAKDASDIAYDNTGSGLTATDVQNAIDELAQGGGGSDYDSIFNRMFTFGTPSTITVTPVSGTASSYHILEGMENVDRSLFKIDGTVTVSGSSISLSPNTQMIKEKVADLTGFTVSPPATAYDVYIGTMYVYVGGSWQYTSALAYLHVATDGTLSIYGRNVGSSNPLSISMFMILFTPTLYISKGD